ncbi:MAG: monovalent cation/H(+) antiporter subunit G [Chloroflexi bacterium OHK40]
MALNEWLTVLLCSVGVAFMLLSSVGVLRMPDLYTRIHAAGKAGTLGVIGVLLGVGLYYGDLLSAGKMVALIAFFLLTSPVAGHMIDRAAYLTGVKATPSTGPDDLQGRYDAEGRLH